MKDISTTFPRTEPLKILKVQVRPPPPTRFVQCTSHTGLLPIQVFCLNRLTDFHHRRFHGVLFSTPLQNRYMVTLGRRALISWSVIAATRARRRAGAVAFIASLSSILRRQALKRWASQAALFAIDTEQTMVALEHCYDGCLRAHLRAWSALAAERRLLRRGFELLLRCRLVGGMAMGFRAWRRYVACVRDIDLRDNRVRVSRPPILGSR